jgi:hypothetical protein
MDVGALAAATRIKVSSASALCDSEPFAGFRLLSFVCRDSLDRFDDSLFLRFLCSDRVQLVSEHMSLIVQCLGQPSRTDVL